MAEKSKELLNVVLTGVCSIIWTLRAILIFIFDIYDYPPMLYFLDILVAIIWIANFIKWLSRFLKDRKNL